MSNSVACIDYRNGQVFIAKRKAGGDMGERWEFPGGKINRGEDAINAIKREMQEEFGVNVQVHNKICQTTFTHNSKMCFVTAYMVTLAHTGIEKPFKLSEHTEYKWIDINLIPTLNFVDSDLQLYPDIINYLKSEKL